MPSIEISAEQAAALDRGESIVVYPRPTIKRFITVRGDGAIFEWTTVDEVPQPWTALRVQADSAVKPGHTSALGFDFRKNRTDITIQIEP